MYFKTSFICPLMLQHVSAFRLSYITVSYLEFSMLREDEEHFCHVIFERLWRLFYFVLFLGGFFVFVL